VLQFMYTHGIKDTVKRNGFATKVVEQALSILLGKINELQIRYCR